MAHWPLTSYHSTTQLLPSDLQCPGNLVEPLNNSLPLDFYWQQWFDRGDEPPIPAGAHRPVAEAATEACRTWMGDSQVGGPAQRFTCLRA